MLKSTPLRVRCRWLKALRAMLSKKGDSQWHQSKSSESGHCCVSWLARSPQIGSDKSSVADLFLSESFISVYLPLPAPLSGTPPPAWWPQYSRDNASYLFSDFRWSWVLINMLSSLSAVFCAFLWMWEICCHCLFKAALSSDLGLGANQFWEKVLTLLVGEMRDLWRKGTGKLILPLHLTLGVSKWSQVKPRSVCSQARGPQGCTEEGKVWPCPS